MDDTPVKIELEEVPEVLNVYDDSSPILMEQKGMDGGEVTFCLICTREAVGKRFYEKLLVLPGSDGSCLVNQQLWALFVLRNVIKYPQEKITDLLKCTVSPGDWFAVCEVCGKTVRDAMDLHFRILKLVEDMKRIQIAVRCKIRESLRLEGNARNDVATDEIVISKQIRDHFREDASSMQSTEELRFQEDLLTGNAVQTKLKCSKPSRNAFDATDYTRNGSKRRLKKPRHKAKAKRVPSLNVNGEEFGSVFTRKRRNKWTSSESGVALVKAVENDNVRSHGTRLTNQLVTSLASTETDEEAGNEGDDDDWMQFTGEDEEGIEMDNIDESASEKKPGRKKKPKGPKVFKKQLKNFYCEICLSKRVFPTSNLLARHMRHHKQSQHPCPKCNFPCLSEAVLEKHLRRDKCIPKYEFKCDFCDFVTERRCNLNQHQKASHPAEVTEKFELFTCDICGLKLRRRDNQQFEYHLIVHKYFENCEEIDGKLKCKICGELTIGNRDLRRHTRETHGTTLGIALFQCEICEKTFSREDSLENHLAVVHTKQCRFFCEQCGYGTMRKSCLEKHMQIHGTDKPFVCELCAAPFKCEKSFKMHKKKVHNSSRRQLQLKCRYCIYDNGHRFENKSLLNRHMKDVHEDLYIYKCDQCENSYLSGPSLHLHQKISHAGQQAECQFCHAKVLNKFYLYGHYQKTCRKKPPGFKFEVAKIN